MRTVVVTGASSGIGRAAALELARGGWRVIGTGRSTEGLSGLRKAAEAEQLSIGTSTFDVADAAATEAAFAAITAELGGVPDAVVNNAGHAQAGAVEDVTDEQARRQLEVNLLAPARIARLVLPGMRARGSGRIVNISSFGGMVSEPFIGWYSASKFALESLSDSLRLETAKFGVQVVLVEPGGFNTGIWERGVAALPPRAGSPYADFYPLADVALQRAAAMPGPERAAAAIRRAVESPRPKARYLIGADIRVGVALQRLLPARASDYVKSVTTGVTPPPAALRRAAALAARYL